MIRSRHVLLAALLASAPMLGQAAATCTITATGPAFGTYSPANTNPTVANGTVTATCNWTSGGSTTVNIVANYSPGNSGAYPNRWMLSGVNRLNYNIYFESSFLTIRGNGTSGTQSGTATLTVSSASRTDTVSGTLFGRIPAQQDAVPGNYSDTIVITMTY
jgi:spore coat protein U-like protein